MTIQTISTLLKAGANLNAADKFGFAFLKLNGDGFVVTHGAFLPEGTLSFV